MTLIELDGSHGEGGGAILRTALGLAMITGKPFRMRNIRKGRKQPGLKHEHLHCIRILQKISDAKAEEAHLGSEEILFIPAAIKTKKVEQDLQTAASTTLVSQCLILATIFSGRRLSFTLKGGTDVKWSPPANYLANVMVPLLKPLGDVKVRIAKRGYYPKGEGILELIVKGHERFEGSALPCFQLRRRGNLLKIEGVVHAAKELEGANVTGRMEANGSLALKRWQKPVTIRQSYATTASPGAGITLWATFEETRIGASALGERGVAAEKVAERGVKELTEFLESEAVVDPRLADQLIPYFAVCGGSMKTNAITQHTRSNIYVAEQFLNVTFELDEEQNIISVSPDQP